MFTNNYDVIIIGAGPIGSYLSYLLSSSQKKVLVLDKKASPGQNVCCTGIISKECYEMFPKNLDISAKTANSAVFISSSGQVVRFWRNEDIAFIIDRIYLEQSLVQNSKSVGTEYQFNTLVEGIDYSPESIHVVTSNNKARKTDIESKTVIIANGFGSKLVANLGLGRIKHFWIGTQVEIEGQKIKEIEIFLDKSMAPKGFAWLVPTHEGKGLAGLLTDRQPGLRICQFISFLKSCGKITAVSGEPRYAPIPLKPLTKTYADRMLVVGEAAGQVKPITGGGIYYGILCAQIAADILCKAFKVGDFSAEFLSQYQKQWHKKLLRELTIGGFAQRLFANLTDKQIDYLFNIIRKKQIPEFIAGINEFSFDTHSKLLLQAAYCLLPFAKHSKSI